MTVRASRVAVSVLLSMAPFAAHAQAPTSAPGAAALLGAWIGAGTGHQPSGIRIAALVDGAGPGQTQWRLEAAWVQSGYRREEATRGYRVNDNVLEIIPALSLPLGSTRVRVGAGPVFSLRLNCGTDSHNDGTGIVSCADAGESLEKTRLGWGVFVGATRAIRQTGAELLFDLRLQGNTIAAGRTSGTALAASVGVRWPR